VVGPHGQLLCPIRGQTIWKNLFLKIVFNVLHQSLKVLPRKRYARASVLQWLQGCGAADANDGFIRGSFYASSRFGRAYVNGSREAARHSSAFLRGTCKCIGRAMQIGYLRLHSFHKEMGLFWIGSTTDLHKFCIGSSSVQHCCVSTFRMKHRWTVMHQWKLLLNGAHRTQPFHIIKLGPSAEPVRSVPSSCYHYNYVHQTVVDPHEQLLYLTPGQTILKTSF
jgi:hypothetical protein